MKYVKTQLENGLNIFLVPRKKSNIVTLGLFFKVGSRDENNYDNGIAHFLEHLMFKGTKNRTSNDIFNALDTIGAIYNAVTTREDTYYYIQGKSNHLKKMFDIISDIYLNSLLPRSKINKEKEIIIEEMNTRFDNPLVKLYNEIHKKIFAGTALCEDTIGSLESIKNIKRKKLINFRKTFYRPENTVFVIVGNFVPDLILNLTKKIFSPIKNPNILYNTSKDDELIIRKNIDLQKKPYIYIKKSSYYQQVYALLVFPLCDQCLYNEREISMITHLLSSGISSRLNQVLREKNGITYHSTSYPIIYSDSGLFVVQLVLNPLYLIKGIKLALRELKKIKKESINKNEIEKIVNISINETLYLFEDQLSILQYIGINSLNNPNFKPNIESDLLNLKKTNAKKIKEVANIIFEKDKINLFIYGNVDPNDREQIYDSLKL